MKKQKSRQRKKRELLRIAEYMASGGAYFWTGYAIFALCDQVLGLNLWWAKLIANLTGWTVNFVLQRYWVFNSPRLKHHFTEVSGRYILLTAVNFLIDYVIVRSLSDLGITPYVGQFVSSGFFTVWNYLWYRFWVFPAKYPRRLKTAP